MGRLGAEAVAGRRSEGRRHRARTEEGASSVAPVKVKSESCTLGGNRPARISRFRSPDKQKAEQQ